MKDKIEIQNVALVLVKTPQVSEASLAELNELVRSANGAVRFTVTQNRETADPATIVGSGKLEEIAKALEICDEKIDVVIFSYPLNALQRRNIGKVIKDCLVIDKTDLILDIFALRATTAEGKKQVELAQLSYSLATRSEENFSRQGGGIGTRGPGETQLETDKRIARDKIHRLRREIAELAARREILRAPRRERDVFTVALVGYTNAGKSTLFNLLTNNDVYADNKLFATLDTTTRAVKLPVGVEVVFTDTVGFIRDLPTQLIDAFKSTLEETLEADLILNVCDISDKFVADHIAVTESLLAQIGVTASMIRVYNKIDRQSDFERIDNHGKSLFISALNNKNVDVLLEEICAKVMEKYVKVKLKVQLSETGAMFNSLKKYAADFGVSYDEQFALFDVTLNRKYLNMFMKYVVLE